MDSSPDQPAFFQGLENWINDHFGFALPLNRLYRKLVFHVFQDSPSPQVALGRDGFVFLTSHAAGHPNSALVALCNTAEVNRNYATLASAWLEVLRHFQQPERNVVLGIAPTTPVVYPDRLPDAIPLALRNACVNYRHGPPPASRLAADAEAAGVKVIYPLEPFIAQREEDNFFPRESFHFSGLSAHLFSATLLGSVGIQPPAHYRIRQPDQVRDADLGQIFGFERELRATDFDYSAFASQVTYQQPDAIRSCYPRALDFGTYLTQSPMTERRALILSDSFGSFTARHLAPAYRQLVWINVTQLRPEDGRAFAEECLPRIPTDDLFFVFHDGSALWDGLTLTHSLLGRP